MAAKKIAKKKVPTKTQPAKAFSEKQWAIGELEIDNSLDKISLAGRLDIDKSEEGLAKARELLEFLNDTVQSLTQLQNKKLLMKDLKDDNVVTRANPFNSGKLGSI